jgi:hypothetical protein
LAHSAFPLQQHRIEGCHLLWIFCHIIEEFEQHIYLLREMTNEFIKGKISNFPKNIINVPQNKTQRIPSKPLSSGFDCQLLQNFFFSHTLLIQGHIFTYHLSGGLYAVVWHFPWHYVLGRLIMFFGLLY